MAAPKDFSDLQVAIHWVTAGLVVVQLTVNDAIRRAFGERMRDGAAGLSGEALLHVACGLLILGLTLGRIALRFGRGVPAPIRGVPWPMRWLAGTTHALLYGFLLLMPVTGALAWFGSLAPAATLHEIGRLILIPLIFAHALGALVEHFVLRNDALRRMLRLNV